MKKILLLSAVLCGLCFQGLAKDNMVIEKRVVEAFEKITADGVFTLYLIQGAENAVSVEVDADLQKEVIAQVKNGILTLSTSKEVNKKKTNCKIYVTFENLTSLTFDGVGKVEAKGGIKSEILELSVNGVGDVDLKLDVKRVALKIDGVGNVELEGKAEELTVKKDGVGKLDASELKAEKVTVRNSGVGNANVYASKELSMENTGVGNLVYSGEAIVKSVENSGVGKIKKDK